MRVIHTLEAGGDLMGVQIAVRELALAHRRAGLEVHLLVNGFWDEDGVRVEGIVVHEVPRNKVGWIVQTVAGSDLETMASQRRLIAEQLVCFGRFPRGCDDRFAVGGLEIVRSTLLAAHRSPCLADDPVLARSGGLRVTLMIRFHSVQPVRAARQAAGTSARGRSTANVGAVQSSKYGETIYEGGATAKLARVRHILQGRSLSLGKAPAPSSFRSTNQMHSFNSGSR